MAWLWFTAGAICGALALFIFVALTNRGGMRFSHVETTKSVTRLHGSVDGQDFTWIRRAGLHGYERYPLSNPWLNEKSGEEIDEAVGESADTWMKSMELWRKYQDEVLEEGGS